MERGGSLIPERTVEETRIEKMFEGFIHLMTHDTEARTLKPSVETRFKHFIYNLKLRIFLVWSRP
jgi:hypothetical protein